MQLFLIILAVLALVWGSVYLRRGELWVGILVWLVVGTCFGHFFYHVNVGPLPITLDRLVWAGLFVHLLFLKLWGRCAPAPVTKTDVVFYSWIGFLFVSTILHDWKSDGFAPMARWLFFFLMPAGVYWLTRQVKFSHRDLTIISISLACIGLYLGLTAVAEARGFYAIVFPRYISSEEFVEFLGRGRGPFLNPITCGIFQVVCLAASLTLWPRLGMRGRAVIVAFHVIMMLGVYCTLTRSVWVGAALGIGILVWFSSKQASRGLMVSTGVMGVLVLGLVVGESINKFKRDKYVSESDMSQSVALRPMLATVALKMFQDNPIFGVGLDQYSNESTPYHYNASADGPVQTVLIYKQHNVFLSLLTETGLVGLAWFIVLLACWGRDSWYLWSRHARTSATACWGMTMIVLLICVVVNGMFHDVLIMPMLTSLLFFIAGVNSNLVARARLAELAGGEKALVQPMSLMGTERDAPLCTSP